MIKEWKQKLLNGLAWAAVVSFSTFIIYNMEVPPPKIYKDGYEVVKIGGCTYRFAYMRSGTCRMLKLNTNTDVPFLIYAVTCWCG